MIVKDPELRDLEYVVGRAKRLDSEANAARAKQDKAWGGRIYGELMEVLLPRAEDVLKTTTTHKGYAHYASGVVLQALKLHDPAISEFAAATNLNLQRADAYLQLAITALESAEANPARAAKQILLAEKAARVAVDLAPWSEDAWKTLAGILRKMDDKAIKEAEEADGRAHQAAMDQRPDPFSPNPDNKLQREACKAYARMFNRLDYGQLEPWLADDLHYESQWVLDVIRCREEYAVYIGAKLDAIRWENGSVYAEMAFTGAFGAGHCVVIAQNDRENRTATVLFRMRGDKITRMDMCFIPSPEHCLRTGEYPD